MNNPPFRIGQRVVAIMNHSQGFFKRGDEFIVDGIRGGVCVCSKWSVSVGIPKRHQFMYCGACGARDIPNTTNKMWFMTKLFAPIEENRIKYVAVSETLREKAVEIAAIETN